MEIFDKEDGDKWWIIACSVLFLAALASLASFFYIHEECKDTTVTRPNVGVYDPQLEAYCSMPDTGAIPQTTYVLHDDSVIYITSCSQAQNLGIIDGRNDRRAR